MQQILNEKLDQWLLESEQTLSSALYTLIQRFLRS